MTTLQKLLEACHADPTDQTIWLAIADQLEEEDRLDQAELARLHLRLRNQSLDTPPGEEWGRIAKLLLAGVVPVVPTKVNSLEMKFVLIPPGSFWMGSPLDEPDRFDDEGPERIVHLTRPFYLGMFPVTQREYLAVTGSNPSHFTSGDHLTQDNPRADCPVEHLSWEDATRFCADLMALSAEATTGRKYRIPTEAEWEYACRAGVSRTGPFFTGPTLSSLHANLDGRKPFRGVAPGPFVGRTTPVYRYPPNAWCLYDMHGNVSQWCQDWFSASYYKSGEDVDPQGPANGEHRVLRGGSYRDGAEFGRAGFRYDRPANEPRSDFGVRVLLEYS